MSAGPTYPRNDLLDALLVALHLQERLDLADGEVLPITKRHHLVKGAEDVKGMSEDLALVQRLAYAADHLGEEVQRVNVLEDVGLLVGDEHHVQLVQGLVDEADIVLLDRRVLGARVGGLGKRGEEGFDAGALDVVESPGNDGLAAAGADGRSEDDLERGGFCQRLVEAEAQKWAEERGGRGQTILTVAVVEFGCLVGVVEG